MRYQGAKLRQMLAAEYVLGTLEGRSRARFRRLLRENLALQREVQWWEHYFAGLAERVPPVTPREQVWAQIDFRINATRVTALPITAVPAPAPRVNLWRAWAAVSTAACVLLALGLRQEMQREPQVIHETKVVTVSVPAPAAYVALLQPPKSEARWKVQIDPDRRVIKLAATGHYASDDAHSLELWLLEAGGPKPLGLLPRDGEAEIALPEELALEGDLTLAVSVEPAGGSPTGLPTGPVILSAPALRAG